MLEALFEGLSGTGDAYAQFRRRYANDPAGFAQDCFNYLPGEGPTSYQLDALNAVSQYRRVSIRGPHGIGKTTFSSWVILWAVLTADDVKVPTTASAWRQLTKFLWPEVHKWAMRLRWDRLGIPPFRNNRELLSLSINLSATQQAFALASDNPASIEGAHAKRVVYVFDEAKAIPDALFDAAEGAFSTGEAYAVAISTPGDPVGRFYDIHRKAPGLDDWYTVHVTLEQAIQAGRVSREWAEQRARQWGKNSAVYKNRVLGEFASSDTDGIIPIDWVEAAMQRFEDLPPDYEWGAFHTVGVDVGLTTDLTVLALRYQNGLKELRQYPRAETMMTAGRAKGVLDRHAVGGVYQGQAVVDVIGIGAGVVGRLRELQVPVWGFNAAKKSVRTDSTRELGFLNLRAEAWWNMRELLDPDNGHDIILPRHDRLLGELVSPRWQVMSGGKIKLESKDDIRKRLGRSTDYADAVIMAFYERRRGVLFG